MLALTAAVLFTCRTGGHEADLFERLELARLLDDVGFSDISHWNFSTKSDVSLRTIDGSKRAAYGQSTNAEHTQIPCKRALNIRGRKDTEESTLSNSVFPAPTFTKSFEFPQRCVGEIRKGELGSPLHLLNTENKGSF